MIGDLNINYNSLIPNTEGLHCQIFSFSSSKGNLEDPRKIYLSKQLRKDRDLKERSEGDLEGYVSRLAKS